MILKLAERTGGKAVRVLIPKLHGGFVRTDSSGRVFLVDSIKGGGQKHTFLFKLKDGKILLDDDTPEVAKAPPDGQDDTAAQAAVEDEAVEFRPSGGRGCGRCALGHVRP